MAGERGDVAKIIVDDKVVRGYSNIRDSSGAEVVQGATYTVIAVNMGGSLIRLRGYSDWFDAWKFRVLRYDH